MREHYFGDLVPLAFGQSDAVPKKPDPSMVYAAADRLGIRRKDVYMWETPRWISKQQKCRHRLHHLPLGIPGTEFLLAEGARVLAEAAEDILRVVGEEKERDKRMR